MQGEILRASLTFVIADRDVSLKYAGEFQQAAAIVLRFMCLACDHSGDCAGDRRMQLVFDWWLSRDV